MKQLILITASVLFLTTLCIVPVESVYHVGIPQQIHRYSSTKPFWDIGDYDHVKWEVLGMTWAALAVVSGCMMLVFRKS